MAVRRRPCQCARCYDRRVERFVSGVMTFDEFSRTSPTINEPPQPAPASCSALQREATQPVGWFKRVVWTVLARINRYVR
jgi:hypothetical protein